MELIYMNRSTFSFVDYLIILLYLGFSLWIGLRAKSKQKNARDFFFGNGKLPFWAVSISIFAMFFSAISFIAMPGEAYNYGLTMYLGLPMAALAMPLGLYVLLRFMYELKVQTCNEYLEMRFSPVVRTISSIAFLLLKVVYLGVVCYASALIIRSLAGWSPLISIVVVGVVALCFAFAGGMTSVVWADVVQFFVMLGGLLVTLCIIVYYVPEGFVGIWKIAVEHGKTFNVSFDSGFWGFDPKTRILIWFWILNIPIAAFAYAGDQVQLQKALAAGEFKTITRSIWGYTFGGLPVFFLFYFTGIAIFAYFKTSGANILPHGVRGDEAFNYFVTHVLPIGVRGLLFAGILAAIISTISSILNSLSTVFVHDIFRKLIIRDKTAEYYLKAARWSTFIFGFLTVLFGVLIVLLFDGKDFPLIEVSNVCIGLFSSFTGGFFILGMLSRRCGTGGVLSGMGIAIIIGTYITVFHYLCKPADQRISFMLIGLLTTFAAVAGGWIAGLVLPKAPETARKYVIWGMFKRIRENNKLSEKNVEN